MGLLVYYRLAVGKIYIYMYGFCNEPSCLLCETIFWGLKSKKTEDTKERGEEREGEEKIGRPRKEHVR